MGYACSQKYRDVIYMLSRDNLRKGSTYSSLWLVSTGSFCRVHIDAGIRRVYALHEPYEREDSNEQGTVHLPFSQKNSWSQKKSC